jgi:two-component system cell cycle response regulator
MMPRAAPGRSLAPPKGIVEEWRLRHYLRSLAIKVTDELTGLYNRRYLLSSLDELIDRVGRDETSAAVLTHQRHARPRRGDGVLRDLANRTLNSVRSVDLVARFGGEEFVIVMPETDLLTASRHVRRAQPSGTTPNGRQS